MRKIFCAEKLPGPAELLKRISAGETSVDYVKNIHSERMLLQISKQISDFAKTLQNAHKMIDAHVK